VQSWPHRQVPARSAYCAQAAKTLIVHGRGIRWPSRSRRGVATWEQASIRRQPAVLRILCELYTALPMVKCGAGDHKQWSREERTATGKMKYNLYVYLVGMTEGVALMPQQPCSVQMIHCAEVADLAFILNVRTQGFPCSMALRRCKTGYEARGSLPVQRPWRTMMTIKL
jgi:hypothetical protein